MLAEEKNDFVRCKCFRKIIFLAIFQVATLYTQAQYYEEKPDGEIAGGIKIIKGNINYGPKSFYITDPNSIGLQAAVRFDIPIIISNLSPYQKRYFNFVVESGYLFCKANPFDSVSRDPNTNTIIHDKSRNPAYFPIYMGFSTRSSFSIGVEVFYWKGLGSQDMWGAKFLSLGYNARNVRINVSGEWYAQTKNINYNGTFLSIDFLWKYVIRD